MSKTLNRVAVFGNKRMFFTKDRYIAVNRKAIEDVINHLTDCKDDLDDIVSSINDGLDFPECTIYPIKKIGSHIIKIKWLGNRKMDLEDLINDEGSIRSYSTIFKHSQTEIIRDILEGILDGSITKENLKEVIPLKGNSSYKVVLGR